MPKNTYPSPCDTCNDSCRGCGCLKWRIRYLYRQKQINAYAEKIYHKKTPTYTGFAYSHPDQIAKWLRESPCKGCKAEPSCDNPCPEYLRWYNARLNIARKKVGL